MFDQARELLHEFKGDRYVYGWGVLDRVGPLVASLGRLLQSASRSQKAALVRETYKGTDALVEMVRNSLAEAGVDVVGEVAGAAPNAPREDLRRMTGELAALDKNVVLVMGGGSTIDAAKAAGVLCTLGGEIDDYFGTNQVTEALRRQGRSLTPLVALQTAASSGAHLTKYSNITNVTSGQKKLIVDPAVVPERALFDYALTASMPPGFTADGAMDGVAHMLEVLYGAVGQPGYEQIARVAQVGIGLIVEHVEQAVENPGDREARVALGMGTDLGGYAIMLGGTNGAHLTSFSLVDVTSHGRATAMMNPYYTVFFAPAIEEPLHLVGRILADAGLTGADIERLNGRALGVAVAEGLLALQRRIGMPTRLKDLPAFTAGHIERALEAAKDPQLRMKLENMPIPLTPDMVDEYMGPVLEAAAEGDLERIKNVP